MTSTIARLRAERVAADTDLVVFQTLKHLGLVNIMLSERECKRRYGKWFSRAVELRKLVGVKCGNRTEYNVEEILALKSLELQQAKMQAEDYLI